MIEFYLKKLSFGTNHAMSVMIQKGQYGLLWVHSTNLCESIQSDVPGFYYTERDVER